VIYQLKKKRKRKQVDRVYPIAYWIRHNSCWSEYSSEFICVDILGETLQVDMISVCAALWLTCVGI
jgi:hypothetical protein